MFGSLGLVHYWYRAEGFSSWIASYEFFCFSWKTVCFSLRGLKYFISNSSVSLPTVSPAFFAAREWGRRGRQKKKELTIHMVSPVSSPVPG
jgi:hypothetical protein